MEKALYDDIQNWIKKIKDKSNLAHAHSLCGAIHFALKPSLQGTNSQTKESMKNKQKLNPDEADKKRKKVEEQKRSVQTSQAELANSIELVLRVY